MHVGLSAGAGAYVASTGGIMANTMGIVTSSYINSLGTAIYTGGKTDVGVSFGAGSYSFTNGSFRGIWNWGDLSTAEKIGYTAGALANVQDITAGLNGINVNVKSRPKLAGHSQIDGDDVLISVGPNVDPWPDVGGLKWEIKFAKENLKGKIFVGENVSYIDYSDKQITTRLYNVSSKLRYFTARLNDSRKLIGNACLSYGLLNGCVNYTSRALLFSGVVNVNALLPVTAPVLLNLELALRQVAIYASPYFINMR